MASTFSVDNIGQQRWNNTKSTCLDTFPVRVKRQDSTIENVMLMDELLNFVDNVEPEAVNRYVTYPQNFRYNQDALQHIQGFPEEARAKFTVTSQGGARDKEQKEKVIWQKRALGDSSEAKTFKALEKAFHSRPSVILNGVKAENILRIARDEAKYSVGQSKKLFPHLFSVPLTSKETSLAEALGVDLAQLEGQVVDLIALAAQNPLISQRDLVASIKSTKVRPGFQHLDEKEKSGYAKSLERAVSQMYNKSKRDLPAAEVKSYLTRFFWDLIEKKDEFDFFMADRSSTTFMQMEVKSYPQDMAPDKDGLKKSLIKADEQLGKGNKFFQNVLAPAGHLSTSWKKINIVCFPEVSSRQQFRDLGLDDNKLKFILTAEELESGQWFDDLGLPDQPATEEEYKRLLAICMGSQFISYNCQIIDIDEEDKNTHNKLVGVQGDVVGIGGEEAPQGGATSIKFSDLKGKPLGHTWSILFWTQEQLSLLAGLKNGKNVVLYGDYGTGKTSLLVSAALEAAKDPNSRVLFFPAISIPRKHDEETCVVLDEALRMKFDSTGVEVVTIGDLRKLHGTALSTLKQTQQPSSKGGDDVIWDDGHQLIKEFIKKESQNEHNLKVFIDELPLSQKDLKDTLDKKNTKMAETLSVLESNCSQVWLSITTHSMLDNSEDPDTTPLPVLLKSHTQKRLKSGYDQGEHVISGLVSNTTFSLQKLSLRVRNSSNIGNSVPEDVSEFKKGVKHFQTSVIKEASSVSTIVGTRPTFVNMQGIKDEDYKLGVQEALQNVLKLTPPITTHTVILCGEGIPVQRISNATIDLGYCPLILPVRPQHHELERLKTWLQGAGGLLVTSNLQFAGMEAPTCIFITNNISEEVGARSGLLRATTRLVVISYAQNVDQDKVRKHFFLADYISSHLEVAKLKNEEQKKGDEKRREEIMKIEEMRNRFLHLNATDYPLEVSKWREEERKKLEEERKKLDEEKMLPFKLACSQNDGWSALQLWAAGAKPGKDKKSREILMAEANLHPVGIQHVVECSALVGLLEDWSAADDEQKEEAEKKIAGLFNEGKVKVVFIPIPALEMEEEKKKELRKNVKKWNTTHTVKCE